MRLETRVKSGDGLPNCTEATTDWEPFCHSGLRRVVTRRDGHEHSATPPSAICSSPRRLSCLSLSFSSSLPLISSWMLFLRTRRVLPPLVLVLLLVLLLSFLVSSIHTAISTQFSCIKKKRMHPFLLLCFIATTCNMCNTGVFQNVKNS